MLPYFLTLFLSITSILSNFTVFTPMTLREELEKIPYAIANFGNIPYGKKMTGRLVLADPLTACKPITPYPSEGLKHEFSENKFVFCLGDTKQLQNVNFVLISRGNCTFVQKSYQAQLLGAKMAVIYDNVDEITEQIIMVEDGHGDEIKIPTIIIPKWIGEKLVQQIEQDPDLEVDMVISFDTWKTDYIYYQFWLNIRNRESYKLVRSFEKFAKELQKSDAAYFEPRYFLDGNFFIGRHNSDNCYYEGKYCFMDPDGWGPAKGTDMLDEIVRQICIYQETPDKWWSYMDKVDQECIKVANMKNCGKKIMEELKINEQTIQLCYDQSFDEYAKTNNLLDYEIEQSKGRSIWPGVSVNNMTYRGNLEENDILEVICASLNSQPSVCSKVLIQDDSNGLSKTSLIVLIVVILFCFFLFLILAYKRWYQKELLVQMDQKVNPMVNQYIAFYETKSQQSKNVI